MGTPLIRAMNTIDLLHTELNREREKRQVVSFSIFAFVAFLTGHSPQAMEMCFAKINKALDRFQGHLINRIRFHMKLHHDVYARRIRVMKKQEEKAKATSTANRRSMRVGIADDLSKEVERLKAVVDSRNTEIESLCKRIDSSDTAVERVVGRKMRPAVEDLTDCESD